MIYDICIYVYVYMCICVYVYMCICVYVYMCICVYVYMYMYVLSLYGDKHEVSRTKRQGSKIRRGRGTFLTNCTQFRYVRVCVSRAWWTFQVVKGCPGDMGRFNIILVWQDVLKLDPDEDWGISSDNSYIAIRQISIF